MRTVRGEIILPANAPRLTAHELVVEVLDISYADAPAKPVTQSSQKRVALAPHGRLPFSLECPEVARNRSLTLRATIHLAEGTGLKAGDLLTTTSYPVAPTGTPPPYQLRVQVI